MRLPVGAASVWQDSFLPGNAPVRVDGELPPATMALHPWAPILGRDSAAERLAAGLDVVIGDVSTTWRMPTKGLCRRNRQLPIGVDEDRVDPRLRSRRVAVAADAPRDAGVRHVRDHHPSPGDPGYVDR